MLIFNADDIFYAVNVRAADAVNIQAAFDPFAKDGVCDFIRLAQEAGDLAAICTRRELKHATGHHDRWQAVVAGNIDEGVAAAKATDEVMAVLANKVEFLYDVLLRKLLEEGADRVV